MKIDIKDRDNDSSPVGVDTLKLSQGVKITENKKDSTVLNN